MKKNIILTAIFLISAIAYADITANAFPFSRNKPDTEQTETVKEVTDTKEDTNKTTNIPAFVPAEIVAKEKDPIVKELEEMQRKHVEDMRKKQTEFRSKRAALLQNYKERIVKEDPEALKSIINSCTESAIENYMRQKGGYDMMDHHMMMGF